MPEPDRRDPADRTVPRSVIQAALVVAAEAAALVALACYVVVEILAGDPTDGGGAVSLVVVQVGAAAVLLAVARGLARARRWARGPSVAVQVLLLPVAYTLTFQSDRPWWGIPVLVLAAAELYLLATPDARAAFDP